MKISSRAGRRLLLLLLAMLLVGCAAETPPQKEELPSPPPVDSVPTADVPADAAEDDPLPFHAAVSTQTAWQAAVEWYYSSPAASREDLFPEDNLRHEPLEQCIAGLNSGAYDVIVIPWNADIAQVLAGYESLPVFQDAVVFVRSNTENAVGGDLSAALIRQAFAQEAAVYWDDAQAEPIIPAMGYADLAEETWQLISRLFGFTAAGQVLDASGFDNPAQAVAAAGREGSGLWPYYAGLLGGDMGINGTVISVDGVFPAQETICDGSYPFAFSCRAVFSPENPSRDAILTFAEGLVQ